jgi:uncharacterized protein (DUF488 family)
MMARPTLFTIGHGARSLEELVLLLGEAAAPRLVDVRRYPGSRRHPQFGRTALEAALPSLGVTYAFRGDALGGRRSSRAGSPHCALREAAFRGYADHMETPEFQAALDELIAGARAGERAAVMCAETLWWQCHRRLIADAVVARGLEVVHLMAPGKTMVHELSEAARVIAGGRLVYDVGALPLAGL